MRKQMTLIILLGGLVLLSLSMPSPSRAQPGRFGDGPGPHGFPPSPPDHLDRPDQLGPRVTLDRWVGMAINVARVANVVLAVRCLGALLNDTLSVWGSTKTPKTVSARLWMAHTPQEGKYANL